MTDRYYALTVLLDEEIRDDDAKPIIDAIKMIKHVVSVEPHVANPSVWLAEEQARFRLRKKLWETLT